jgi:hypothetical protein
MADRQVYLENREEPIAAQKREEQRRGVGITRVAKGVGVVALIMLAHHKVNLSRLISADVKTAGEFGADYSRYAISEIVRAKNTAQVSGLIRSARTVADKGVGSVVESASKIANWTESLLKPIPNRREQFGILDAIYRKQGIQLRPMPLEFDDAVKSVTRWNTLFSFGRKGGPIRVVAPNAPIVLPGRTLSSGAHGGAYVNGKLFKINEHGRVYEVITGVRSGVAGTSGSRTEFLRAYSDVIDTPEPIRDFVRNTLTPDARSLILEHRRIAAENFIRQSRQVPIVGHNVETSKDVMSKLSAQIEEIISRRGPVSGAPVSARQFFFQQKDVIKQSARTALERITDVELAKPSTKFSYFMHKLQRRIGLGEQYSAKGQGILQKKWLKIRESLRMGTKDPISLRQYRVSPKRFRHAQNLITGEWPSGRPGKTYLYQAGGKWKRTLMDWVEGTYFKHIEMLTGMDVTTRPSWITNLVSRMVGAQRGSYGEYAIRRYLGGHLRVAALGAGAYATYKLIDFMARQATGWGIKDVAGKLYTTARETQQKTIDTLGITRAARRSEELYPGSIKSPASMLARMTAPYWMMRTGGFFSKRGGQLGLALGIATALITWGDITQSPEELHRIYTGQQDIPVRKGRYWMFGKTPMGGGKIQYWKPHWYPLLRSKYKYQGQLWDSEKEQMAQGSLLSPILAPLLTGKAWDPYYWEKKHYRDRPYPMTAELFEPTMPFGWLLNQTIGRVMKPQRIMHPEYWGIDQGEQPGAKNIIPGSAEQLGFETPRQGGLTPTNLPSSPGWAASEGAYTLAEQMGLRGWAISEAVSNITGRPNFLPEGPVAQSARRATGWERAFWDSNIGDPYETTEWIRRVIPHRRRGIEEYNPIPNEMPSWMPGEDYFTNFRTGDPYTKVELGEARLPGAGYEALHELHSRIPKVYDAVDRFLILSDVAPYSKEYNHYKYLAIAMTKKDPFWSGQVQRHIEQRAATQKEYDFLSLEPPEDAKGIARQSSLLYREALEGLAEAGGVIDPAWGLMKQRSILGIAEFPLSKRMPYRTAKQAYKDFRLHGSEFTDWGNPIRDFLNPAIKQAQDLASGVAGQKTFIPQDEKERREYEEYFDKLTYVKYKKLAQMAKDSGNTKLASQFESFSKKTMTGVNAYGNISRIMGSIPKRERSFLGEFAQAEGKDREEVLDMVPPQMARIYRAMWAMRDTGGRARNDDRYDPNKEAAEYFSNGHYLPDQEWSGWNPEIDLRDVQIKTVKNEGMNIHNFDLWESQVRAMQRRPDVPMIPSIMAPADNIENIRRVMIGQVQNDGYKDPRIYTSRTPATQSSVNLRIKVKRDRNREFNNSVTEMINA